MNGRVLRALQIVLSVLLASVLTGCFEKIELDNHPCDACAACEVCVSDGSNGVRCERQSHARKRCGSDNTVYWVDSCGQLEERAEACLATRRCSDQGESDAICGCANRWQGNECTVCPAGWDPKADCNACQPYFTGDDCNICLPHRDISLACGTCIFPWAGADCNICPGNWDAAQDCTVCRNRWTGSNCDTCPVNFEPTTDCSQCKGTWGGESCAECRGHWSLLSGCTTCLPGWQDLGDDCGTCLPGFEYVASSDSCQERCGNGAVTTSEVCDDGNDVSWDGCDDCAIREQRINTTAAGDDTEPVVATSASGSAVVVWRRQYAATGLSAIFAQRFSATGQPEGAEFQVSATATATIERPAVAMTGDGRFIVVWEDGGEIVARRFAAAGTSPLGAQEQISGTDVARVPDVAMASDGSAAVVWVDSGLNSSVIRGGYYSPNGVLERPLAYAVTAQGDRGPHASAPSVAISLANVLVVAYVREALQSNACDKVSYVYGSVAEVYAQTGCIGDTDEANPHLVVGPGGLLALTWITLTGSTFVRHLGSSTVFPAGEGGANVFPRVALGTGNVGVVVKVTDQNVLHQRFGPAIAAQDVRLNGLTRASPAVDLAVLPNDDFLVVWSATLDVADGSDIFATRVNLNGEVLPWDR